MPQPAPESEGFPLAGGLLLGLGLGGFVDGIVFHQILQWHHLVTSAGFPPNSVGNLQFNTLMDGLFHAATWAMTLAGVLLLWAGRSAVRGMRALFSALLLGFGLFNLAEGTLSHFLLGIHHVNETVPREQWIYWDLGFLLWGAVMLAIGLLLYRRKPAAG